MQRFFDIVFSALALMLLGPLLVPISLVLRMTGEGEIFFRQERVGLGTRPFKLLNFAAMLKDSPSLGTGTVTIKGDSRIVPVGRLLRKTKINELPQLLNILFGHMSIIGPRPLTRQTFDAYTPNTQGVVTQVRPGLSGIGSIIFRGEEEILTGKENTFEFYKNVIAPYKGALELWYVENKSLYTYFVAIIVTIWVVLFPGASLVWFVFKDLPIPPAELKKPLGFRI
jgi:lipopolysaccharide/colanic/teichoic acid biosynthesis glycosyltransferase